MNRLDKILNVVILLVLPIVTVITSTLRFIGYCLADNLNILVIFNYIISLLIGSMFIYGFFKGRDLSNLIEQNKKLRDDILDIYKNNNNGR